MVSGQVSLRGASLRHNRDLADRPGVLRAVIEECARVVKGDVGCRRRLQRGGSPAAVARRDGVGDRPIVDEPYPRSSADE